MRALILLLVSGTAAAQEASEVTAEAPPKVDLRGRVSASGVFFTESAPFEAGQDPENGDAATENLLYTDLRGRIDARKHGGGWAFLGDARLRLTPGDEQARGFLGGNETDLREAGGGWKTDKLELFLGRQFVPASDYMTVDGVSGLVRAGIAEVGVFGGLYPNPFSRSLTTDYDAGLPITGGAWGGWRTSNLHGSAGVTVIAPREDVETGEEAEPLRAFVASRGYARLDKLNLFHYLILDLAGPAGFSLTNLQLGATFMATTKLRLEAGASYQGTLALRMFLRDLLESPDTAPPTGTVANNLVLARIGSTEGRLGVNYSFPAQRVDLFAAGKVRRRVLLAPIGGALDATITEGDNEVDVVVDVSGGVRHRRSILGLSLGLSGGIIRGSRSAVNWGALRIGRTFLEERLEAVVDASFLGYADQCDVDTMGVPENPSCTGRARGLSLEVGAGLVWMYTRRWLFLVDYRLGRSTPTEAGTTRPTITNHTLFVRAQYSF